jgi:hypothetical protein
LYISDNTHVPINTTHTTLKKPGDTELISTVGSYRSFYITYKSLNFPFWERHRVHYGIFFPKIFLF